MKWWAIYFSSDESHIHLQNEENYNSSFIQIWPTNDELSGQLSLKMSTIVAMKNWVNSAGLSREFRLLFITAKL